MMYAKICASTVVHVPDFKTLQHFMRGSLPYSELIGKVAVAKPLTPAQLRRVPARMRGKICSEE